MKIMKRTLCLMLALLLVMGMLPTAASAVGADSGYAVSPVAVNPAAESSASTRNAAAQVYSSGASIPMTVGEFQQLMLTNKERLSCGLNPLSTFASLQDASDIRAVEIADYFSHTRPDGTSCGTVLDDYGIGWNWRGENIAYGYGSAASVTNAWMNSDGHRANILNENYTHLGVGLYGTNWVQTFVAKSGTSYTQAYIMYVPTVTAGTDYEETFSYAVLTHSYYGECFMPVSNEFLSGYNPNTAGTQKVTVSILDFVWELEITVSKAPTELSITTQPADAKARNGKTVKTTVEAEGDGLTYQWYFKDPGSSSFSKSSATTKTYACTMTDAKDGRKVYCVITDAYGNTITTRTATLSMIATELKITSQPKSVTVAPGATAKVTVQAQGDGLTYRWYYKNPGASSYTYTSSFKGNSYYVTMNDARDGRQVLCRVYDKYGNVVQTNTVKLSMEHYVEITQQPKSVTVAKGETAKVTVKATGDGLTYRWYYKNAGASSYTYTASFTGNSYYVTMNDARNGRLVLCRVYDKYGNVVQTNTVILKMS